MELENFDEIGLDLPPEYCTYPDEGCEFSESCLNCPLPVCVYEEPNGRQRLIKEIRNKEIVEMHINEGKGTGELAEIFGFSQRTIQRTLKKCLTKGQPEELSDERTV